MQVFEKATALSGHVDKIKTDGYTVGFVPTMGSLHAGHLSLVAHALSQNSHCIVSIFVNPTQFNNADDLSSYPRDVEGDLKLLEQAGCHSVFVPSVEEVYPSEVKSSSMDLKGIDKPMEGKYRPGHFEGVATVVSRLFNIVKPTRAYFGEKDYQQLMVIRQMVKNENFDIEIIGHPIERNDAGLALSSRNQLLSPAERDTASIIWQNLDWARHNYKNLSPRELQAQLSQNLSNNGLRVEYVNAVNEENLREIEDWPQANHARLFVAAYLGGVRLIDNVSLF